MHDPVTRFRPFRNTDPPALTDLWNRGLPERGVVRPLTVHEFDALVMGKLPFERAGLIVAERHGRTLGYAHAGFAALQPNGPSHRLDVSLGTVALMVLEPDLDDPEIEQGLWLAAERYLRSRGATVFYAGGRFPMNPFYWGIYGGSEFSGILGQHASFHRAALRAGYRPAAGTVLLEADLSRPEPRDPRALLLRRQARLELFEDAVPDGWWQSLAIGLFRPTRFQLVNRADSKPIARAMTWDIACGFGVGDGRPRTALIDLEVVPDQRRKGYARLLVSEIAHHSREQLAELLCVQTSDSNTAALALYASLGFEPVESATLYRLPAELGERSRS
jgi:ribosomal protein S18 acetylase RimI-like enzyme